MFKTSASADLSTCLLDAVEKENEGAGEVLRASIVKTPAFGIIAVASQYNLAEMGLPRLVAILLTHGMMAERLRQERARQEEHIPRGKLN